MQLPNMQGIDLKNAPGFFGSEKKDDLMDRLSAYLILPKPVLQRCSLHYLEFLDSILVTDGQKVAAIMRQLEGLGSTLNLPQAQPVTGLSGVFHQSYPSGNPGVAQLAGPLGWSFLARCYYRLVALSAGKNFSEDGFPEPRLWPVTPPLDTLVYARHQDVIYWLTPTHPSDLPRHWYGRMRACVHEFPQLQPLLLTADS